MAKDDQLFYCPVELALDVIGGKWATIVLSLLKEGVHRYGALRRRVPQVSEKVLVQRLRSLEERGLIARHSDCGKPPLAVSYRLTEEGESLVPVLNALYAWGEQRASRTGIGFVAVAEQASAASP
ncbi:helix-turn-helix transcriptional regulator [Kitasatospora acidiphila]|uniref:Helix-turn-helix transcriptional regulator n=1 Tax=Kitasatospora acidiphila TaxID=2567942 RepID=A0A540W5E6_9ACTN|nr:helix-turn-helix domain-containing protein [Kitasatospora acidiphila]TQF04251.1 helix-turn-helix transcriptional regulator [Kitasatospora acidiphila]